MDEPTDITVERVPCDAGTVQFDAPPHEAAGRVYRAVLIRPGVWAGKGIRCPAEVLAAAAPRFEGLASFLNPPPPQPGQHGHPMLERLLGITEHAVWDASLPPLPGESAGGGIVADYRLADTAAAAAFARLVDGWLADKAAGRPVPAVGLSAVPWVRLGPRGPDGLREVREIISVDQVDAVYRPAAGGEFLPTHADLSTGEDLSGLDRHEVAQPDRSIKEEDSMDEVHTAMRDSLRETRLALSGLPDHWRRVVSDGLPADWTVEQLDQSIQRVKAACAGDAATRTVTGIRPVASNMQTGLDQLTEAFAALVEGRRPKDGIQPLAGLREAYLLLSGDYEMTGRFHEDRVYLANANSTTMSNLVANVLNKAVVNEFQAYPRWWEPICRRENFGTLQTVKWVTLGGVGELPSVDEGAAYTELSWSDAAETAAWQKRGGYLGLTLEAMDKDDVGRLRRVAPAMAQAAWLTLGKAVSTIFTTASGAGPTLADGKALFHSDHNNLATAALSSTSWAAARLAMRKQAEVNSGERLGALTQPKYLLVPPDLEATALTLLATEGALGSANNDINPYAVDGNTRDARLDAARKRIIVVDLWTDANNWAAAADPRLYPTIGIGFRYGETPELFSVASPYSGLMFTNDVMPVKARWFFAVGAQDYRGLYKANVG